MTRAEAIKKMQAVKAYMTSGNPIWDVTEIGEALDMAIKALEEPQWILCSETDDLPDHEVLCRDLRGNMLIGYLCTDEGSDTGFLAESDGECLVDCVAWREKPEPWQRGDTE
jgi:hypothetical protein